jgi:hypothetical protein
LFQNKNIKKKFMPRKKNSQKELENTGSFEFDWKAVSQGVISKVFYTLEESLKAAVDIQVEKLNFAIKRSVITTMLMTGGVIFLMGGIAFFVNETFGMSDGVGFIIVGAGMIFWSIIIKKTKICQ